MMNSKETRKVNVTSCLLTTNISSFSLARPRSDIIKAQTKLSRDDTHASV